MKKNLLYLLALLITFSLFPACSDDDKDPEPEPTPEPELNWSDYIGSYGDKNALTLNGVENSNIVVTVAKGTGDNANISFANLFPEAATITISDIEMKESNGVFAFTKEQQIDETLFTITGTLTPGTVARAEQTLASLSVNITRKVVSDIVGNWSMRFVDLNGDGLFDPDFRIDAKTGNPQYDYMLSGPLAGMVQGLLKGKVQDVNIKFTENGIFDFSWRPVGVDQDVTLADALANINDPIFSAILSQYPELLSYLTIQYYTKENVLYMALDANIVSLLPLLQTWINIDLSGITDLMVNNGAYYALPISMKQDEDTQLFYMDKNMLGSVLGVALPLIDLESLIGNLDPATAAMLVPLLQNLPMLVAQAEQFDVALGFVKE